MIHHSQISQTELRERIRQNKIQFAGNSKLKIYGTLACSSGKRMKRENRVFFATEPEAIAEGFRPCGRCLREKYSAWKR
ncbi:MAG: metal-binding protein [bacterium]|nr:metal-binding protein [bacterium]